MDLAHWLHWSGPLLKNRHEIKPFPVEWATLFVSSRNLLHGIVVARSSPFSFSGGLSAALLYLRAVVALSRRLLLSCIRMSMSRLLP